MNSKKANIDNDDLKFIPLNIDSSLSPNGSKFPILYNLDGLSLSGIFGSISLELPNLNVSPIPLEMVDSITPVMAPLMPYPKNTPNLNNDNSLYNNNSKNTTPSEETSNNKSLELEYPDELNNNLLHSYNEPTIKPRYLNDSVNAVDVLRNFDLSLDYSINESRKNSCTEEEVNNIFSFIFFLLVLVRLCHGLHSLFCKNKFQTPSRISRVPRNHSYETKKACGSS